MSKLTISLTDRKPVVIDRDDWPVLAYAEDDKNDDQNGIESQANRTWDWRITVRQHSDGRCVVYGKYEYDTRWQNESSKGFRRGELLATSEDVIAAIKRVGADLESCVGDGVFARLVQECIANLPAEEI